MKHRKLRPLEVEKIYQRMTKRLACKNNQYDKKSYLEEYNNITYITLLPEKKYNLIKRLIYTRNKY